MEVNECFFRQFKIVKNACTNALVVKPGDIIQPAVVFPGHCYVLKFYHILKQFLFQEKSAENKMIHLRVLNFNFF